MRQDQPANPSVSASEVASPFAANVWTLWGEAGMPPASGFVNARTADTRPSVFCSWTDFESRKTLDQPRDGLFASRESHMAIRAHKIERVLRPLPACTREWIASARADHQLYARAACTVSRWLSKKAWPSAATTLLSHVA